jgi:hypothetical protein
MNLRIVPEIYPWDDQYVDPPSWLCAADHEAGIESNRRKIRIVRRQPQMPKFEVINEWRPFGAQLPAVPRGTIIQMSISGPPFWFSDPVPEGVNPLALPDRLPLDFVSAMDAEALNWLVAWWSSDISVWDLQRRIRHDPALTLNLDGVPKHEDALFALMTDMPCSMGLIPAGLQIRVAAGQVEGFAKDKYLGQR